MIEYDKIYVLERYMMNDIIINVIWSLGEIGNGRNLTLPILKIKVHDILGIKFSTIFEWKDLELSCVHAHFILQDYRL